MQCTNENEFNDLCGEKGLSQPLVLFGSIIFNTYVPPLAIDDAPICAPSEGSGQSYVLGLQDATAVEDFNTANNIGGIQLDRSYRLDSGGIPSDPVLAGSYDNPIIVGGDSGGNSCSEKLGVLLPDLNIELFCSIGIIKKYWYIDEPE
jgi:hypothetical protein